MKRLLSKFLIILLIFQGLNGAKALEVQSSNQPSQSSPISQGVIAAIAVSSIAAVALLTAAIIVKVSRARKNNPDRIQNLERAKIEAARIAQKPTRDAFIRVLNRLIQFQQNWNGEGQPTLEDYRNEAFNNMTDEERKFWEPILLKGAPQLHLNVVEKALSNFTMDEQSVSLDFINNAKICFLTQAQNVNKEYINTINATSKNGGKLPEFLERVNVGVLEYTNGIIDRMISKLPAMQASQDAPLISSLVNNLPEPKVTLDGQEYDAKDVKRFDLTGTSFAGLDWVEVYDEETSQYSLINPTSSEKDQISALESSITAIEFTNSQDFAFEKTRLKADTLVEFGVINSVMKNQPTGKVELAVLQSNVMEKSGELGEITIARGDFNSDAPSGFVDDAEGL